MFSLRIKGSRESTVLSRLNSVSKDYDKSKNRNKIIIEKLNDKHSRYIIFNIHMYSAIKELNI